MATQKGRGGADNQIRGLPGVTAAGGWIVEYSMLGMMVMMDIVAATASNCGPSYIFFLSSFFFVQQATSGPVNL